MAKENVAKFYEKLAEDPALAERLQAADKAYAEKHGGLGSEIDDATRRKAAEEIVLPIAAEMGLPFTIEELAAYEEEQLAAMEVSDDEMANVAGGWKPGGGGPDMGGKKDKAWRVVCCFIGIGAGKVNDGRDTGACFGIGVSTGPIAHEQRQ